MSLAPLHINSQVALRNDFCSFTQGLSSDFPSSEGKFLETLITVDTIRNALAFDGRPKKNDYCGRLLCWLVGVGENHFERAEEIQKAKETSRSVFRGKLLEPIHSAFGFNWHEQINLFHDRLMSVKAMRDPYLQLQIQVEWSEDEEFQKLSYRIPLRRDPFSTDCPAASLEFKYNKEDQSVLVASTISGKGSYFGIQLRSLAMTLSRHGLVSLEEAPKLDWNEVSFMWKANNPLALEEILQFYETVYSITFDMWGELIGGISIFPHAWDKSWYSTFVSKMVDFEGLPEEYWIEGIHMAGLVSSSCQTPCFDLEDHVDYLIDRMVNFHSVPVDDQRTALTMIRLSQNVSKIERLAEQLLEKGYRSEIEDWRASFSERLIESEQYRIPSMIVKELLSDYLPLLKEMEPFSDRHLDDKLYTPMSVCDLIRLLLQKNQDVDILLVKEFLEEMKRLIPKFENGSMWYTKILNEVADLVGGTTRP